VNGYAQEHLVYDRDCLHGKHRQVASGAASSIMHAASLYLPKTKTGPASPQRRRLKGSVSLISSCRCSKGQRRFRQRISACYYSNLLHCEHVYKMSASAIAPPMTIFIASGPVDGAIPAITR
jgi:hypothetical protein